MATHTQVFYGMQTSLKLLAAFIAIQNSYTVKSHAFLDDSVEMLSVEIIVNTIRTEVLK
jgi:hypothetical protein